MKNQKQYTHDKFGNQVMKGSKVTCSYHRDKVFEVISVIGEKGLVEIEKGIYVPNTEVKLTNPLDKNIKIAIALAGGAWYDLTNDRWIGNATKLVKYVNDRKYVVTNEECFRFADKFWYNKKKA